MIVGSAGTVGTSGADTFTSVNTATESTYASGDVLVGGDGADVLNITADNVALGAATSVVGIETINVTAVGTGIVDASSFNAGGVTAVGATLNLSNKQTINSTGFTVTALGTGATVAADSTITGTLSVTTAAADTQTITLAANKAATQTLVLTGTSGTSDVATVSAAGTVGTNTAGTAQIETVNLSGNGAAVTYNVTGAATTYNLTGTQSVTLGGNVTSFDGKTITDATTAGVTTLKITTAGNADLSKATVDLVDITSSDTAYAYSVKAGQAIKISDATTTEVATFDINDNVAGNVTTGAISIDLAGVLTTAKGIALNATKTDDYINKLSITNNTSDNATANIIAANADVTLSGTKVFTLESTSTAASFDATGLSGVFTATATANNNKITAGSGNDSITVGDAVAATVAGGLGNDTLHVTTDMSKIVATGFEILALDAAVTVSKASQWNGQTYVVTDAGPVNVEISALDSSTLDLSGLNFAAATTISVNSAPATVLDATKYVSTQGLTFVGSNVADTVTGTANADIIDGGKGADVLKGADGADTITGGLGADTITGGAGIDTINLTEATASSDKVITDVAVANRDVINGFTAGATNGDILQFVAAKANNVAHGAGAAAIAGDIVAVSSSGNVTGAAGKYIYNISVETVSTLSTDGASVLDALVTGAGTSGTITAANAADILFFLVSDGTNVGVYRGYASASTADTAVTASEIGLVATLNNTTLANLAYQNFYFA